MKPLWIIGCGGHASEVIESARSGTEFNPVGILDDNQDNWGKKFYGVPVIGPIQRSELTTVNARYAVIAIGSNPVRSIISQRLDGCVEWARLLHPTAYITEGCQIDPGTVVGVNAIVQPGSHVGRHVVINTSSIVGHDVRVEDCAHIGPGVILAGGAEVGAGTFVGTGTNVIPNARIGSWSVVGAGSTVVHELPPNVTAVGTPAKVIKEREPGWHR